MKMALVVDDSRTIRNILTRILSGLSFTTVQANNGREGLQALDGYNGITLICADWNMPEMNGLEFVTELRKDARFATVPVLMITTETHLENITRAMDAGVNEYLMKPFTAEMVREKLSYMGVTTAE